MARLAFTDKERAELLAAMVLDYLNEELTESELELGGEATDLYNTATAFVERDSIDKTASKGEGGRYIDEQLSTYAPHFGDETMAGRTFRQFHEAVAA